MIAAAVILIMAEALDLPRVSRASLSRRDHRRKRAQWAGGRP